MRTSERGMAAVEVRCPMFPARDAEGEARDAAREARDAEGEARDAEAVSNHEHRQSALARAPLRTTLPDHDCAVSFGEGREMSRCR